MPRNGSVNFLSGAQAVFTQLLDERGTPHAQQPGRFGNGAVGFLERFANQSDFNRRQVILEIDPTLLQGAPDRRAPIEALA